MSLAVGAPLPFCLSNSLRSILRAAVTPAANGAPTPGINARAGANFRRVFLMGKAFEIGLMIFLKAFLMEEKMLTYRPFPSLHT